MIDPWEYMEEELTEVEEYLQSQEINEPIDNEIDTSFIEEIEEEFNYLIKQEPRR